MTSFFLMDVRTVGYSAYFFTVVTVNVFSQVNKIMPTSLDEYL